MEGGMSTVSVYLFYLFCNKEEGKGKDHIHTTYLS